jgi:hypothetical protein
MAKQYTNVGGLHPRKSAFNLSYEKKLTCRMGEMIPIMCDEVIPGDIWKIGNEIVVRLSPMVAPILHDIKIKVDYFFCPYRLLWTDWEDFITGGPDGDDESEIPTINSAKNLTINNYSLWDYLGLPIGEGSKGIKPTGFEPILFPWIAYEQLWFEFYRDEDFQKIFLQKTERPTNSWKKYLRDMEEDQYGTITGLIKLKNWQKDYFTSARPDRQKGTSPAIPLVGESSAEFNGRFWNWTGSGQIPNIQASIDENLPPLTSGTIDKDDENKLNKIMRDALNNNVVDLGEIQGADINDIRNGFQVQKFLERNQRAGSRYTEQLQARWGIGGNLDSRLDRPEYIGGSRTPIIISEVLQTGGEDQTTGAPLGNMGGHGLTADKNWIANYRAKEWGLIMGIMTIQPKLSYCSQGVNKQWLRRTRYDFPTPEFVNLSEQPILEVELYATNNANNNAIVFGYQGIYDEARTKQDMICGDMRYTMDQWHMARKFSGVQNLNDAFLKMQPITRPFVLDDQNARQYIVNIANNIKAIRPLPFMAEPGLIDHH